MATKVKAKATKASDLKAKKSAHAPKNNKSVAKARPSAKKPVTQVKKTSPKTAAKTTKPAVKAKTTKPLAKKPIAATKKTAKKAVKSPNTKAKTTVLATKTVTVKVKPAPKVAKSRKKATKMDKKMARTLIKIANATQTAVANGGVQSAAMAALRATVAMQVANTNQQTTVTAQAAAQQVANANRAKDLATKLAEKPAFKAGDVVVYPAHGVGKVEGLESHTIGGMEVRLFKITFDHERMTLKVPVARATGSGLRQLSTRETMRSAFETMKGRARVRRVMWSRRAQEYEQKINSGDPVAIAEVLRDLRRNAESGDQSYSERQIFQAALERLGREVAAIEKIDQETAMQKLSELLLRKAPAPANDGEVSAA